jgi:hypothetical protein
VEAFTELRGLDLDKLHPARTAGSYLIWDHFPRFLKAVKILIAFGVSTTDLEQWKYLLLVGIHSHLCPVKNAVADGPE